jgi:hypothetical protein
MFEREGLYFIIRYTPFWAVPAMVITGEYAYIFWLRNKKWPSRVAGIISGVSLSFIIFYYWAGGPEKSVKKVISFFRFLTLDS